VCRSTRDVRESAREFYIYKRYAAAVGRQGAACAQALAGIAPRWG